MRTSWRLACIATGLLACLGCDEDPVSPAGDAVRGQVVDWSLEPVPGAWVSVGDRTVRTDAYGNFVLEGVATPYDIVVVPYGRNASVYMGLVRRDPVLLADLRHGFNRAAEVRGHVPPQLPSEPETRFAFAGRGVDVTLFASSLLPLTGEIRAFPRWRGPETVAGTLHILRVRVTQGVPAGDYALAQRRLVLQHGAVHEGVDFTAGDFAVAATVRLRGTIATPPGYQHQWRRLKLHVSGASFDLAAQFVPGEIDDSFEYLVPDVAGATFSLSGLALETLAPGERGAASGVRGTAFGGGGTACGVSGTADGVHGTAYAVSGTADGVRGTAYAVSGTADGVRGTAYAVSGTADGVRGTAYAVSGTADGVRGTAYAVSGLHAGDTGVDMRLPPGVLPLEPPHEAPAVDSTTSFAWFPGQSGLFVLRVTPSESSDPEFTIFLASHTTRLPARTALGLALPSGAAYAWQVRRILGIASVDAAATWTFLADFAAGLGTQAFSESRTFTTR